MKEQSLVELALRLYQGLAHVSVCGFPESTRFRCEDCRKAEGAMVDYRQYIADNLVILKEETE